MAQHRIFCDAMFDKPGHGRSQHGDHKETTYTPLTLGKLLNTDITASNRGDQLDQNDTSREPLQVPFNKRAGTKSYFTALAWVSSAFMGRI